VLFCARVTTSGPALLLFAPPLLCHRHLPIRLRSRK
jgi:hypothetical protein